MGTKEIITGVAIFIIFTIGLFILLNVYSSLPEAIIVVIALGVGLGAEILYRKKARSKT